MREREVDRERARERREPKTLIHVLVDSGNTAVHKDTASHGSSLSIIQPQSSGP